MGIVDAIVQIIEQSFYVLLGVTLILLPYLLQLIPYGYLIDYLIGPVDEVFQTAGVLAVIYGFSPGLAAFLMFLDFIWIAGVLFYNFFFGVLEGGGGSAEIFNVQIPDTLSLWQFVYQIFKKLP